MTSCKFPRRETKTRYAGVERSASKISPAFLNSSTVSNSGTKSILAIRSGRSTRPVSFASTTAANKSSGPFVIETI